MSLNFDLTAVKTRLGDERYEELTTSLIERDGEKLWHDVTNQLVWMSMAVGLGKIEEKNLDEWSFRIAFLEKLDGPSFRFNDGRQFGFTRRDLEDHVGLRTNVTEEKRSAWIKRIVEAQAYRIKLPSGEPQEGLAISAHEQVNLIHREYLAKGE